jgi:uncharacterized protein (DUF4415 family)
MKDNYDFTSGKRGSVVATTHKKKKQISIRFDSEVVDWFKHKIEEKGGGSYQALMNKALLDWIGRSSNQ